MGFLIDDLPGYKYTNVPDQSQSYQDRVDANTAYASRPASEFQNDLNKNVREQSSSLMGPSNPDDPNDKAMNARANQIYEAQINAMTKGSAPAATQRQINLQNRSIDENAAAFSNQQSRASIQWQQISFQREAAITQEATKRQLYSQLFGGLASLGGMFAAKGIYNARHPSPVETSGYQGMDTANFNYGSGSIIPNGYNSANLGPIGGR